MGLLGFMRVFSIARSVISEYVTQIAEPPSANAKGPCLGNTSSISRYDSQWPSSLCGRSACKMLDAVPVQIKSAIAGLKLDRTATLANVPCSSLDAVIPIAKP